MADRLERRTRGLLAIAITDATHGLGLRPISLMVLNLRALFRIGRLEMPTSPLDLATQIVFTGRAQSKAMTLGCVGALSVLALPILLPIEIIGGLRIRRHNQAMRRLIGSSRPGPRTVYRDHAGGEDAFRRELPSADALFAIDWTIWRDGTVCFAGTALGILRGNEHVVRWLTVHRGPPPQDAIDAAAVVRALPELPVASARWEWELDDPFEAVERQ